MEILGSALFRHRNDERVKALAMLQEPVDVFIDEGRERIRKNSGFRTPSYIGVDFNQFRS